ncbi:SRPBCC family protein [Phycicoccus sp. SLBN-51]|uniref:SRPBCC family protein n=1 Tax=Phycicoccus sp. SLBN-51 TaxID=2768447 RepID=UPI001172BF8E|nr:polyketide cyclase/dehydrase/lipid transport protein [Phycicoccus sp. SLBN-51]
MTTTIERTVTVEVPVHTAYNQWTQFEEFPQFMSGVNEVTQVDDTTLHWVAEIGGVRREWDAAVLEQVPDQKVAWAATQGATNAGAVHFAPSGPDHTIVTLHLEFEPEGLVEKAGDALGVVERQAEGDLQRFKTFIEERGTETGAWRGQVNEDLDVGTPGVEAAEASRGDSGKAGVSGKAVAAGVAAAAVGAAGVAVAAGARGGSEDGTADLDGPDVVDVLTTDHREATALIGRIWATTNGQQRRDVADQLIAELVRHAVAEEMYVYPAMREHLTDGDSAVQHDLEEHQELEEQMKRLEGLDGADAQFTETLRQLEATLADHIADEEREHFPRLRASLPREELVKLAGKVETAKKMAPTRPHPGAPDSPLFHKAAGPGVGLVDRLRDKLTGRSTG